MPVPVFATTKTDAFSTLGVRYDASPEEIKLAYKRLALRWHPDRHLHDKEAATQRFIEIHDAYRTLTAMGRLPAGEAPSQPKRSPGARHTPMADEHPSKKTPPPRYRKVSEDPPKQSPPPHYEHMYDEYARTPGTRYATMPDEYFPKQSPGARYAMMPEEDAPERSPGPRFAAMAEAKRSPGPTHATMPEERRSHRRSPGPKYAAMPEEHPASKRSPGPRHAAMPGEHPSSKRSPGPRHATMPGEHPSSKRSPGPRYAAMAEERDGAAKKSPMARFASMYSTPAVTPFFRPAKLRKERTPKPRRDSATHDVPPYTPSSSRSSHAHSTYSRSDPGHGVRHRGHHQKSAHAPHAAREYSEGHDSDFSDYVEIKHHEVPLGAPLTPLAPRAQHGHDVHDWVFPLALTLEELYRGTTQRFRITAAEGHGAARTITIVVPPGTAAGARVVGVPGVVFEVKEIPHTYYRRVDSDVLLCVEIPWSGVDEAEMRGGSVCFVGLGGEDITVPMPDSLADAARGTCVKTKGMPVSRGGKIVEYGDLYIRWEFFVPGKAHTSKWSTLKKAMNFRL